MRKQAGLKGRAAQLLLYAMIGDGKGKPTPKW